MGTSVSYALGQDNNSEFDMNPKNVIEPSCDMPNMYKHEPWCHLLLHFLRSCGTMITDSTSYSHEIGESPSLPVPQREQSPLTSHGSSSSEAISTCLALY